MSNKELLHCPFCGGETKIDNRGKYGYGIVCISCGAKSPDFQTETNAIKSWNDYANDLLKTEQIKPEISLVINGLLEAKRNYPEKQDSSNFSEKPNSSKEMPLVPKWRTKQDGYYILEILITQADKMRFTITHTDGSSDFIYQLQLEISLWGHISYLVEECGQFNTLKEAKQKANECIQELGERLVYFSNNIKTEE